MKKYVVGRVADLPEGERLITTVKGRTIGVFNVDGDYFALLNRCPHQGAELCKGDVLGLLEADAPGKTRFDPSRKFLACPWHGWEFDLKTGQSYFDPQRTRVRSYPVGVESGSEMAEGEPPTTRVKGPYVAEMFDVSVEDEYLVVTLP